MRVEWAFSRQGKKWTQQERDSVRVAFADPAWNPQDVAVSLRRTVEGVLRQAYDMRIKSGAPRLRPGVWTEAEVAELDRLRKETRLPMSEIAHMLGRSKGAAEQITNRRKLAKRAGFAEQQKKRQHRPQPKRDNAALVAELIRRGINPQTARMVR